MDDERPLGNLDGREAFFEELGKQIEDFLLFLEGNCEQLCEYVKDPFAFLKRIHHPDDPDDPDDIRPRLTNEAKAILLQSNYSVVKEAMKYRTSTAVHWVCVWVI